VQRLPQGAIEDFGELPWSGHGEGKSREPGAACSLQCSTKPTGGRAWSDFDIHSISRAKRKRAQTLNLVRCEVSQIPLNALVYRL
jgi:hypothetical protein